VAAKRRVATKGKKIGQMVRTQPETNRGKNRTGKNGS